MPRTQLCVTVTGTTTAELRKRRDEVTDADLIELRLDTVGDPSAAGALAGRRTAVIVTCRPPWEGGRFAGSEEERKRLLVDALELGAEYVDLEWRANFEDVLAETGGRRILLSMHDFDGVPSDLAAREQAMRATGAEAIKIAVTPKKLSDIVPLLDGTAAGSGRPSGRVVVGMGPYGVPTRVLASRFGSAWTYAGGLHDLGQLDARSLVEGFQFKSITDRTSVYGIVGGSVAHSVSPAMHNAAFRAAHVDAVYVPLPAVDADDFVRFGRAIGISGASVTIPHKVALVERLDELDAIVRRIGAVNTIRAEGARWLGRNTDTQGFLEPLRQIPLKGLRASLLGAGGAARAVAVALAPTGCALRVHARHRAKAEEVASLATAAVGAWPPEPGSWDLLVNATPVGMSPRVDASPIPAELLSGRYVYDLVYNPLVSRLLREAAARGCRTIGGLDMLVAQAGEQFHWWTGSTPPAGVMREAALKRLAELTRDEPDVV